MKFNRIALAEFMRLRRMTKADLTKHAGLSAPYVTELLSGAKRNPTYKTLQAIAEALEIEVDALFCENHQLVGAA